MVTPPSSAVARTSTALPALLYLAALPSRFWRTWPTCSSSPTDQRQVQGHVGAESVRRPASRLALDGLADDVPDDQRIAGEDQPSALRPTQDEEVLREPSKPVSLLLDVGDGLPAGLRVHRLVALAQDLAHPVDRRDRGAQLMADDTGERVAQGAGPLLGGVSGGEVDRTGQRPADRHDQELVLLGEGGGRRRIHLEQADPGSPPLDRHGEPRADRLRCLLPADPGADGPQVVDADRFQGLHDAPAQRRAAGESLAHAPRARTGRSPRGSRGRRHRPGRSSRR